MTSPRDHLIPGTAGLLAALTIALASASLRAEDAPPPDPFADMVARTRQSVLAVGSYLAADAPSIRYFGTGFIIADGTVLATNAHVVEAIRKADRFNQMRVFVPDAESAEGVKVTLLAEDRFHDVALLKLPFSPASPLELDLKHLPRQGQTIGVIGYPIGTALGVVPAVHRGVVSAVVPAVLPLPRGAELTPELAEAIRNPYSLYQLDLVVYPGHSGSPLLDANTGKVLGIINKTLAMRTREHLLSQPSAISYAVPVRWIDELLQRTKLSNNAAPGPRAPGAQAGGER